MFPSTILLTNVRPQSTPVLSSLVINPSQLIAADNTGHSVFCRLNHLLTVFCGGISNTLVILTFACSVIILPPSHLAFHDLALLYFHMFKAIFEKIIDVLSLDVLGWMAPLFVS
jgi:hypothetical protein